VSIDNEHGQASFKHIGTRPPRPDGLDKVTGRADYGADFSLPGMIYGKVLRSPHAHAEIRSINVEKALALDGVFATCCRDDFPVLDDIQVEGVVLPIDVKTQSNNIMARTKALYHGHAIAAVAACSEEIAEKALQLIDVDYEVLPHVSNLDAALAKNAPLVDETLCLNDEEGNSGVPTNIALHNVLKCGDIEEGFKAADLIIENTFTTPGIHQGYIEPHSCVVNVDEDGKGDIWCSTQGAFAVQTYTAHILGIDTAAIKVTPSEIGGGFGGKLFPYLEPLAFVLSRKAGRSVKMTMTREEVFRASGHAPATRIKVKIGVKKSGHFTAMQAYMEYEAGAFRNGSMHEAQMNIFSCYNTDNMHVEGIDVLVNKLNVTPYRAPGLPPALLVCESVVDDIARELNIDPVDLRLKNISKEGDTTLIGMKLGPLGLEQALVEAKNHIHYRGELPHGQGRGIACAFYLGGGCHSSATLHLKESGKLSLLVGTPDIGGSRASMALMVAETLDVPVESVVPQVADTESVGFSDVTGGSRVTVATGTVVVQAAEMIKQELCSRAALIWEENIDDISWELGAAHSKIGDKTLSIEELARSAFKTGGTISVSESVNATNAAPSCCVNIIDVDIDRETGKVDVTKVTVFQDAGRAIHPDFVEGQMQGGVAQGIGWALNEEYIYDNEGKVMNPGFLDYRMPLFNDLPMIDTVIIEVPNPHHPYGVRGVGEAPICAPMAAVAIAVNRALGTNIREMPMRPSRVMSAIMGK
jgi:CO/xanthine dehydrogenase Mo-binding subunit